MEAYLLSKSVEELERIVQRNREEWEYEALEALAYKQNMEELWKAAASPVIFVAEYGIKTGVKLWKEESKEKTIPLTYWIGSEPYSLMKYAIVDEESETGIVLYERIKEKEWEFYIWNTTRSESGEPNFSETYHNEHAAYALEEYERRLKEMEAEYAETD